MSKKKIYSFLVILFLGLNFMIQPAAVFAQDPTGTPPPPTTTITAPPPFQPVVSTSSVGGNGNYSCPTAGIVGWGTLTPSSAWNLLCSQCVTTPMATSTAHPTGTSVPWAGTGTPPAGCTPMPNGTGTPAPYCSRAGTPTPIAPTVTPVRGVLSCYGTPPAGVTCTNMGNYLVFDIQKVVTGLTGGATMSNFTVGQYKRNGGSSQMGVVANYVHTETSGYALNTVYTGVSVCPFDAGCVNYAGFASSSGAGTVSVTNSMSPDFRSIGGSTGWQNTVSIRGDVNWPITGWSVTGKIYLYADPAFMLPTPIAPTGTPNPNYCYSVSSVESGFSWSGVTLGTTSCMDIGPYDGFDFGGLTSNPIGAYPWLAHICLQDVSFGVAEIFGVSISLQVVLYILGIVALIRNMFVS